MLVPEELSMSSVSVKTADGAAIAVTPEKLDALRAQLRGALCLPGEPGYEDARTLWNAMIDRRPAAVIRAAGAAYVTRGVQFARAHGLLPGVKGRGPNIAGNAVCEGGLLTDLSPMRSGRGAAIANTARPEP